MVEVASVAVAVAEVVGEEAEVVAVEAAGNNRTSHGRIPFSYNRKDSP